MTKTGKKGKEEKREADMPDTSMADAFKAAIIVDAVIEKVGKQVVIKTAAPKTAENFMTAEQVENIEVKILSAEELAAAAAEAKERQNAAQALGGKLSQLITALEQIYSVQSWEFNPKLKEAAISYEKQILNLQSQGDKDFQEQIKVALLFSRIHTTAAKEENIRDLMNQVAKQGRGNLCSVDLFPRKENNKRDYGSNAVVFKDIVLVPANGSLGKDGRQTKTDHGLFTALRWLIERYYSEYQKEQEEKIAFILSNKKASENLEPILDREVDPTDKVGTYRIHFPEQNKDGKLFRAGAAIFEVGFRRIGENPFLAVEIKDGGGSFADFKEMRGFFIPFNLLFAKELPEKMTGKRRENAERFIRVFRAATYSLRKAFYEAGKTAEKAKKENKKRKIIKESSKESYVVLVSDGH